MSERAKRYSRQFWVWRFVGAGAFLAAAIALTYPLAAQWQTQYYQSRAAEELSYEVSSAPEEKVTSQLSRALEYNQILAEGGDVGEFNYLEMVSIYPDEALARLRIPSINLDQVVHHTMSERVLATGLGHMEGTSLPVGGENTNAVIGGHRGLASAVGLTDLNKVAVGDQIHVDSLGQSLVYEVSSYEVLSPGDADMQPVQPGRDLVTLVTCTPLGLNTERIVVVADRVDPAPPGADLGVRSEMPGFPWWALGFVAALTLALTYLWWPLRGKQGPQDAGPQFADLRTGHASPGDPQAEPAEVVLPTTGR